MKRTKSLALVLLGLTCAIGCGGGDSGGPKIVDALPLVASHALTISEPSGLTMDEAGTALWTVTNKPERVYKLDLTGAPMDTLNYVGHDLEGIAYDPATQTLWVAEEKRRELVQLDLNGDVLSRHRLDLTGQENSGLEGICLDDTGQMFVLNEKDPGLFVELSAEFGIASRKFLAFAGDYSGLSYDSRNEAFWVLSDQDEALYLWSRDSGVMQAYALPFPKPEGVAFDEAAGLIYVVSDSENMLYVFRVE